MSVSFSQPEVQISFDHVHHNDYQFTAKEMVDNLGRTALTQAIDRQFEARLLLDGQAVWFWGRVCGAIVLIRTAEAVSLLANPVDQSAASQSPRRDAA